MIRLLFHARGRVTRNGIILLNFTIYSYYVSYQFIQDIVYTPYNQLGASFRIVYLINSERIY